MKIILNKMEIQKITKRAAKRIIRLYDLAQGEGIVFLIVKKGAIPFGELLKKELEAYLPKAEWATVKVSSYKGTRKKTLELEENVNVNVAGKLVIVIEDIVDTGDTMLFLIDQLLVVLKARRVEVCTLLAKNKGVKSNFILRNTVTFIGKVIPLRCFVIGFGFDYPDDQNREWDIIIALEDGERPSPEEIKEFFIHAIAA